jgi:glutamine cyclotransferase
MKINYKLAFLILLIAIVIITIPHFYHMVNYTAFETKDYTLLEKISRGSSRHFTQGLFYLDNGLVCESTGLYGKSKLITYEQNYPSKIIHSLDIIGNYFAEGACILNNTIYQLTWREGKMY